ncbi:uncharacterized protein EI97DRAFT_253093 [Westerdykella ornata]|uniref:Uncharacterized protein n=1 Tax=Westerdykella ornata TaxID=318751 RepID=A0A6A6JRS3_WESOR|nr:uncharacterized protein EI97DRAFT_253093 [Westerdykella ornata]KAF2278426.1 hypothetical protein EI97DRAFT_253093 [Westerdykella ornata]
MVYCARPSLGMRHRSCLSTSLGSHQGCRVHCWRSWVDVCASIFSLPTLFFGTLFLWEMAMSNIRMGEDGLVGGAGVSYSGMGVLGSWISFIAVDREGYVGFG